MRSSLRGLLYGSVCTFSGGCGSLRPRDWEQKLRIAPEHSTKTHNDMSLGPNVPGVSVVLKTSPLRPLLPTAKVDTHDIYELVVSYVAKMTLTTFLVHLHVHL